MEISRPPSALSDISALSELSDQTDKTLAEPELQPKTLVELLRSRRAPVAYQSSSLKEGHEGRRRRRRYEMQNLLGCPQRVEPTAADWSIAPQYERKTIQWEKIIGVDHVLTDALEAHNQKASGFQQPMLPRSVRSDLKRSHVNTDFVKNIEKIMRDVIDPASAEPDYEIIEPETQSHSGKDKRAARSIRISIDGPNESARSYSRYWVHLISKYYQMRSFSADLEGERYVRGFYHLLTTLIQDQSCLCRSAGEEVAGCLVL